MSINLLSNEWRRLETLADIVTDSRNGKPVSEDRLNTLKAQQSSVLDGRMNGAWSDISPKGLEQLEYDVLACSIAPDISPRIAWQFQSLHGRQNQPYPTLHFIQELLSLEPSDTPALYQAVNENSPLRAGRLISTEGKGPFTIVEPGPGITDRLVQRNMTATAPPGTMQVSQIAHWDDLILPAAQMESLREFLAYITLKETIVREWGALPTGGPIALFSGSSGTGKTFAASVIATELGWPLYRVDLGRLVSKYIGETEKNLNALFDGAHNRQVILQFDEADALFSKRGEVKEARDRYANLEVSHLLARIETHNGPCILTTNLRDQMDTAFARRFHVVIDFPRPDAKAREKLWARLLPPLAPFDDHLDLERIGSAVSMSGGSIRNAAIHAAIMAARQGSKIGMTEISRSAWRELNKEGRPVGINEIGSLDEFLGGGSL